MFDFANHKSANIAYKEVLCDNITPFLVLCNLRAKVLLESAYNETGKDRYSIVILNEAFSVYKEVRDNKISHTLLVNGVKTPLDSALKGYKHTLESSKSTKKQDVFSNAKDSGFLEALSVVRSLSPNPSTFSNVPSHLPLPLGGAGYIGYEFFAEIEDISFTKPSLYNAPECAFIFGRDFLIFDHLFDRLHILSVSYKHERSDIELESRIKDIESKLRNMPQNALDSSIKANCDVVNATKQSEYESMVESIKQHIYRGDLLQCVPSQYMQITSNLPPLLAYRHLRHKNPSPYMFYYDFSDFIVLGASPEIMIRLKSSSDKSTFLLRPIAGTRPRGESVAKDMELESELLNDKKELAEHLMLLDLARNDAGRVSVANGVKVLAQNTIERYSHVMHIVSQVEGELDTTNFAKRDAFKAAFPAGTLSGAPKIEAIKTIERLESHARGIYGGAIGYFTYSEDMDFAIAIRTAIYQNGNYFVRAGAGIVQDSNPSAEYIETQNKMQALLDILLDSSTKAKAQKG